MYVEWIESKLDWELADAEEEAKTAKAELDKISKDGVRPGAATRGYPRGTTQEQVDVAAGELRLALKKVAAAKARTIPMVFTFQPSAKGKPGVAGATVGLREKLKAQIDEFPGGSLVSGAIVELVGAKLDEGASLGKPIVMEVVKVAMAPARAMPGASLLLDPLAEQVVDMLLGLLPGMS